MKVKQKTTRKVEDGRKTLFPRNVWGPLGCHLLSSLVPKSRFRGSEKIIFFKKKLRSKKMQKYPLSIFHAAVRPETSPGADLSTFWKVIFSIFSGLFGPFRAQLLNLFIRRVVWLEKAPESCHWTNVQDLGPLWGECTRFRTALSRVA